MSENSRKFCIRLEGVDAQTAQAGSQRGGREGGGITGGLERQLVRAVEGAP